MKEGDRREGKEGDWREGKDGERREGQEASCEWILLTAPRWCSRSLCVQAERTNMSTEGFDGDGHTDL